MKLTKANARSGKGDSGMKITWTANSKTRLVLSTLYWSIIISVVYLLIGTPLDSNVFSQRTAILLVALLVINYAAGVLMGTSIIIDTSPEKGGDHEK